jgi:hypothetical protein
VPPLLLRPHDRAHLDAVAARLSTYWELPPGERAPLLDGLADLVNELHAAIGDRCGATATDGDGPALLLRQFAHARRRLA